jgi:TonB family protein
MATVIAFALAACSTSPPQSVKSAPPGPDVRFIDSTGGTAHTSDGNAIKIVRLVPAKYPPNLRRSGATGTVHVSFIILADGHVDNLQVVRTDDIRLDPYAMEAAAQWLFEPYTPMNGKNVSFTAPIKFSLDR